MAKKTFLGMTGNAGLGVLRKPAGQRSPNSRYRKVNNIPMHRLIVEQRTGLKLKPHQQVHHVDPDDKITNEGLFVVCEDAAYHQLLEMRTRALKACGNPNFRKCRFCEQWDDPKKMLEKEWTSRGRKQLRWDHYQYRYKCVSREEFEQKKNLTYLAFARTEGIWKAVGQHEVQCTLCDARMSAGAIVRATHAKMHVRKGEAVARHEPKIHPKASKPTRTVYYPADKQIGTTQLSEREASA